MTDVPQLLAGTAVPARNLDHRGSPVGSAYLWFLLAIVALAGLAAAEGAGVVRLISSPAGEPAVVAATVMALAAVALLYRWHTSQRLGGAALLVGALLAPGAVWSWFGLVAMVAIDPVVHLMAVGTWGTLAAGSLVRARRSEDWVEVFGGLGALAIGLSAAAALVWPALPSTGLALPVLVAVGGMACLYGILVDVEVAGQRTVDGLVASRERIEAEIARTEEILHDLRSGLLAIETAIAADGDSELSQALQTETARLRRLTVVDGDRAETFDLLPDLRALVVARQASGTDLRLEAPATAPVHGDRSSVLAIVDNLVANAIRHGRAPVSIKVDCGPSLVSLRVVDRGGATAGRRRESWFERGATDHPEGSGIGLHRARRLARANGGELYVEADAGDGTTSFVLTLASGRGRVGAA